MKVTAMTRKLGSILVGLVVAYSLPGCSSSDEQKQAESEVEASDEALATDAGEDVDEAAADAAVDADAGTEESDMAMPSELEEMAAPGDSAAPMGAGKDMPMTAPSAAGNGAASGRRVMFVKGEQVEAKDSPSASGKTTRTLQKGDHVLVEMEGDWAHLADGSYVPVKQLSERPISRSRIERVWDSKAGN